MGKPAKFHLPKAKCRKTVLGKSRFARGFFRWIRRGSGAKTVYVLIGCPKGKWDARRKRCRVGTKAHEIVRARRGRACPTGWKRG